jgi:hypothetical protein
MFRVILAARRTNGRIVRVIDVPSVLYRNKRTPNMFQYAMLQQRPGEAHDEVVDAYTNGDYVWWRNSTGTRGIHDWSSKIMNKNASVVGFRRSWRLILDHEWYSLDADVQDAIYAMSLADRHRAWRISEGIDAWWWPEDSITTRTRLQRTCEEIESDYKVDLSRLKEWHEWIPGRESENRVPAQVEHSPIGVHGSK